MDSDTRRAVAFIVTRMRVCDRCAAIFDHTELKQFQFTGIVRPEHVSVYDFFRKCHVGGQRAPQQSPDDFFSLYDFGNGRHLTLSFRDALFHGYDHKANKPFSGSISGNSVTIRDGETDADFYYSV